MEAPHAWSSCPTVCCVFVTVSLYIPMGGNKLECCQDAGREAGPRPLLISWLRVPATSGLSTIRSVPLHEREAEEAPPQGLEAPCRHHLHLSVPRIRRATCGEKQTACVRVERKRLGWANLGSGIRRVFVEFDRHLGLGRGCQAYLQLGSGPDPGGSTKEGGSLVVVSLRFFGPPSFAWALHQTFDCLLDRATVLVVFRLSQRRFGFADASRARPVAGQRRPGRWRKLNVISSYVGAPRSTKTQRYRSSVDNNTRTTHGRCITRYQCRCADETRYCIGLMLHSPSTRDANQEGPECFQPRDGRVYAEFRWGSGNPRSALWPRPYDASSFASATCRKSCAAEVRPLARRSFETQMLG